VATLSKQLRSDAAAIFRAALDAANAGEAVRRSVRLSGSKLYLRGGRVLSLKNFDRIFVIGAGKAGAAMAVALEQIVGTGRIAGGVLNVKRGHAAPKPKRVQLHQCAHPVPDEEGERAAREMEALLREMNARDLAFVLISGGASALLPAPAPPVTLRDKQKTTDLLLKCGADIFQLNAVRKHLSELKGGRLAALAYPATVVSLILSDVIGDPLDVIGSGPTSPDSTTYGDALRVLSHFNLTRRVPRSVLFRLEQGAAGALPDTPKPADKIFENVVNVIVGSNRLALKASADQARRLGYKPMILSSSMQGETREVARAHCEILREVLATGNPIGAPACVLSGGETTVTVKGDGKGGRNQEFALASAIYLDGLEGALVLSAGTDGTDGPTDAAGAIADGYTAQRANEKGLSLSDHLRRNDSHAVFSSLGDLVKTGSTGTNVMDLNIMLARGGKTR
jgi:hydroxypyruvate reductase